MVIIVLHRASWLVVMQKLADGKKIMIGSEAKQQIVQHELLHILTTIIVILPYHSEQLETEHPLPLDYLHHQLK